MTGVPVGWYDAVVSEVAPAKMTLTNVEIDETLVAQFNPVKAEIELAPAFNAIEIPNLSYAPLQFRNTPNPVFTTSLTMSGLAEGAPEGFILDVESLLLSWCYAPDEITTLTTASPPRILLVWPGWIAVVCALRKVKHSAERFRINAVSPTPTLSMFDLSLEAFFRVPIGAQTVRQSGFRLGT
jgi:hypothetical protein